MAPLRRRRRYAGTHKPINGTFVKRPRAGCTARGPVALRAVGRRYLDTAGGLLMITSTRRFCCRPAAESLLATGSLSPLPEAERRIEPMPCPARYDFTESARRSDNPWL